MEDKNEGVLLTRKTIAYMLPLEGTTSTHLQEAVGLQLAQYGCLLSGVLQGKRAHMVSPGQRARLPVQQGLALCWYHLLLCPRTAACLQLEAYLSTAARMACQSCMTRQRYFMML